MKNKILLTSTLALAISVPAMAADPTPTTVTSTSSCTETTLGTATGPVDIEADWQANTINLTWDANNGTVSGIQNTTCTYADTFELPTSITRTGYEFAGWLVKNGPAQCSAS
ncbi:MAG: InlB B-repeat-containing protein, partial [Alphaproteobacteria bacterium]